MQKQRESRTASEPESRRSNNISADNTSAELLAAASAGILQTVQRLVEGGVDLNAKDQFGNTALIYAAAGGHLEIVRWLINRGAVVKATNQVGVNALLRATMHGHKEVVALLKSYEAEDEPQLTYTTSKGSRAPSALLRAARDGSLDEVRACLARGADVNQKTAEGWTALMLATLKGHTDVIRTLLAHSPTQVNACSHNGWTALRFAIYMSDSETVSLLLAAGAEVNAPDNDGWTALMQAAGERNIECLEILLAAGAEVNARNKIGETASVIASHKSLTDVVELLEKGMRES